MKRPVLAALIVAARFVAAVGAAALESPPSAELLRGIEQVESGAYEDAIVTLDAVVRALSADPTSARNAARACFHLGMAYLGLKQDVLADAKFRQSIRLDPDFRLDPTAVSARVLKAFTAALQAARQERDVSRQAKRKTGKGAIVAIGLGSAATVGIAVGVAARGGHENTPPQGQIAVTPEGRVILSVTEVTLTATIRDAESDPVVVTWDFGDGATGSGLSVIHVFSRTGPLTVTARLNDGRAESVVTQSVHVVSLSGRWRSNPGYGGETIFDFVQRETALTGTSLSGDPPPPIDSGALQSPRTVRFRYRYHREFTTPGDGTQPFIWPVSCFVMVDGTVDAAGDSMTGTATCQGCSNRLTPPEIDCGHRPPMTMTFARQ